MFAQSSISLSKWISGEYNQNLLTTFNSDMFLSSDATVSSWLLMKSPWPILTMAGCYLYFVLKFGPQIMLNRKPYKLTNILVFYNTFMVLYNAYICFLSLIIGLRFSPKYIVCSAPSDKKEANALFYAVNTVYWHFTFTKLIEFADTVFFVLRKKQSQVSVLHVYHHTNMMTMTWAYTKYAGGEQSLPVVTINSFVHIFMYTYYSMAAVGVHTKNVLFLKKSMTKLQLTQFILIIGYFAALATSDCNWSKGLAVVMAVNTSSFLLLFLNFYRKAYYSNKRRVASEYEYNKNIDNNNKTINNNKNINNNSNNDCKNNIVKDAIGKKCTTYQSVYPSING